MANLEHFQEIGLAQKVIDPADPKSEINCQQTFNIQIF